MSINVDPAWVLTIFLVSLRIGAYQRFFMRVPSHAAVSDTVEALKELKLERATGITKNFYCAVPTRELPMTATARDHVGSRVDP